MLEKFRGAGGKEFITQARVPPPLPLCLYVHVCGAVCSLQVLPEGVAVPHVLLREEVTATGAVGVVLLDTVVAQVDAPGREGGRGRGGGREGGGGGGGREGGGERREGGREGKGGREGGGEGGGREERGIGMDGEER